MNPLTLEQAAGPTIEDYAYSRLLSYIKLEMPSYIIGKHHKLIAHYLQKLEKGDITRLAIFMPPRHGKCVDSETLITISDGSKKRACEIQPGDSVLSYSDGKICKQTVVAKEWANKTGIKIKTRTGREIIVSHDHPMLTFDGYKAASDLNNEDFLLTINSEFQSDCQIPDAELDMITCMIFEGCCSKKINNKTFTNNDQVLVNLFKKASKKLGIKIYQSKSMKSFEYRLSVEANPFLDKYLINNHLCYTKRIPQSFFSMPIVQKWRFIDLMFQTDGYFCQKAGNGGIALANEKLINDIQSLLSLCKIASSKSYKSNDKAGAWALTIGRSQLQRIYDNCDLGSKRSFCKNILQKKYSYSMLTTYPSKLGRQLKCTRKNGFRCDSKKNISIEKLIRLSKIYPELNWYLDMDFIYDQVVKTTTTPEQNLIHLQVAKTQNFIANDFVSHNTLLASEFFSSWYLGRNPEHEIIFSSYAQERSDDVGKSVRNLMKTEIHNGVFPEAKLRTDSQGTRKFQTIAGGSFFSVGWGGSITGRGASCALHGTIVETDAGPVAIEKLHNDPNPPRVLSLDYHGQLCYSSILKTIKIEGERIYECETRSGKRIRATADHRIYSRTRGFIRFEDIRIGEELVCRKSRSNVQIQTKKSRQTSNPCLHSMSRDVCSVQRRCPKIYSKRISRCLLFQRMFFCRPCNKKQQKMCNVQSANSENENRESFWCEILPKMPENTTTSVKKVRTTMPRMWTNFPSCRIKTCFLQSRMLEKKLFKSIFEKQQKILSDFVYHDDSSYFRKRQTQMCRMWCQRENQQSQKREISNKFRDTSYRCETTEQRTREFGDSLQTMSFSDTSLETDIISMAPRLYKSADTVYDLRVEETHNYFTEGILSHNCLIMDDLIKDRADAQSETSRRKREEWFTSTAYTRLMSDEGVKHGRILLIMTRWAYNDIAAFLLNDLAHENWHILNCPAIAEENDALGRVPGEALWPEKYPLEVLATVKQSVGTDDWTALYQQRPLPKEGGMIKLHWFDNYDPHKLRAMEERCVKGKELPEELNWFYKIVISLDTAYKPNQINDPSALTVWGYSKTRQYLLESVTEKLEFPQLKVWLLKYYKKYMKWGLGPVPVLIEDAASGQSLIQVLRQETNIPVIAIYPEKSKVIRMEHASDYIESGRVSFPERAKWLTDLETELAQFPYGKHDDQCDSISQYIKWIYKPRKRKSKKKMFFK